MSDATPTPDPDGAIYPDGASGTPLVDEKPEYHEPGTCDDGGDKCYTRGDDVPREAPETPSPEASQPSTPNPVTSQVDGEMLIANLLVEIANLTRRALVAETMVQMYQRAAQPKPAQ